MARQRIIWSPRAKLDLFEILDFYYKRNGSKTYSVRLNFDFQKATKMIAKYPNYWHPNRHPEYSSAYKKQLCYLL